MHPRFNFVLALPVYIGKKPVFLPVNKATEATGMLSVSAISIE